MSQSIAEKYKNSIYLQPPSPLRQSLQPATSVNEALESGFHLLQVIVGKEGFHQNLVQRL